MTNSKSSGLLQIALAFTTTSRILYPNREEMCQAFTQFKGYFELVMQKSTVNLA